MIVAGADVWKGKWVVVILNDGRFSDGFIALTFSDVMKKLDDATVIGVDIPIGLPEVGLRRDCDVEARRFVGGRRHSVFFTPPVELLICDSARTANDLARELGVPGISAQTFALKNQILAVRPFAELDDRIYEVHPEVSFRAAHGEEILWPKNSWNGQMLRRKILASEGIEMPQTHVDLGAAEAADILDAAIVAWSASRIASRVAKRFPSTGLRANAIWH